jgi:hypothetical protein
VADRLRVAARHAEIRQQLAQRIRIGMAGAAVGDRPARHRRGLVEQPLAPLRILGSGRRGQAKQKRDGAAHVDGPFEAVGQIRTEKFCVNADIARCATTRRVAARVC